MFTAPIRTSNPSMAQKQSQQRKGNAVSSSSPHRGLVTYSKAPVIPTESQYEKPFKTKVGDLETNRKTIITDLKASLVEC